jgi:hypothetical protein
MLLTLLSKNINATTFYTIYMDSVKNSDTIFVCGNYDSLKIAPMKDLQNPTTWMIGLD